VVAAADLLVLSLAGAALLRGAGILPLVRWLPLAGISLYLLTDIYYCWHAMSGAADFIMAELGFFGGYWMVTVGASSPWPAQQEP